MNVKDKLFKNAEWIWCTGKGWHFKKATLNIPDFSIQKRRKVVKFNKVISPVMLIICAKYLRTLSYIELSVLVICKIYTNAKNIFKFFIESLMHPGYISNCLKGLIYVEKMLIAHIHPVNSSHFTKLTVNNLNAV